MRSDRLRRMEETETQARSGLTRFEQKLWGRSLHKLLLHPTSRFSGILERNGPVGAGLYVAAYCLLRLALRLTLLIYTVVLLSQPTDPTGAVGVLSALGFLCVILAVIAAEQPHSPEGNIVNRAVRPVNPVVRRPAREHGTWTAIAHG